MHAWNGRDYDIAGRTIAATRFLRVHLAGTFDGQTLKLFVNGKHRQTTKLNGKFSGSGYPMTIGASPSPLEAGIDFAFAGVIDGGRVSKTVRYTEDFEPPTTLNADDDTLAVYRFDEGRGSTLTDSSGNKHHGEIRGAKWVSDIAIRHRAALGLAEFRYHAVDVLTEALKHKSPDVRLEAATALGMIGEDAQSAVSALKQLAGDKDQRVTAAADQALTKIEGSPLFKSILKLFK